MRVTWLGWAGVEVEAQGERVVVDPLNDAGAVFAPLGERARDCSPPNVAPASPEALAGMVTHLHRDHADAAALIAALAPGAPVLEPCGYGGDGLEQLAVAQADHELSAAGLARRVAPRSASTWATERRGIGPVLQNERSRCIFLGAITNGRAV